MIDVYNGTLGFLVDKDKLRNGLNKLLIEYGNVFSYEIVEDRTKVMVLTGKYEKESDVDYFYDPFIFTNNRGNLTIAIDIRPFMKNNISNITTILEGLQDKYNANLQLRRLIFNKLMLDNSYGWLNGIKGKLLEAFSTIISSLTTIMLYDKTIKEYVEITSKLHMISMDDETKESNLTNYITRLPSKDITMLTRGKLTDFYSILEANFNSGVYILPSRTINDLVNNIKLSILNGRGSGLNADLYIQTLSTGFYSFDSKRLSTGLVEHIPTFLAVYMAVMSEGINSRSNFRKMLLSNKRNTNPSEVMSVLDNVIKQNFLTV